jgi:hypothetical protein
LRSPKTKKGFYVRNEALNKVCVPKTFTFI